MLPMCRTDSAVDKSDNLYVFVDAFKYAFFLSDHAEISCTRTIVLCLHTPDNAYFHTCIPFYAASAHLPCCFLFYYSAGRMTGLPVCRSTIGAVMPRAAAAVREPAYDKSVRFRKKRGRSCGGDYHAAGDGPLRTGRQAASLCGFVKTAAQVPAARLFCTHTSTARLFPHPATERTLCFWAPACLCMRYLS